METVQEEITKENKEKDDMKVFDSISAIGLPTSLLYKNQWLKENSIPAWTILKTNVSGTNLC